MRKQKQEQTSADIITSSKLQSVSWTIALRFEEYGYRAQVNPFNSKLFAVDGFYPHINILKDSNGTILSHGIVRVEIEESLKKEEAERLWTKYHSIATSKNLTFYLAIPEKAEQDARSLCKELGIQPTLLIYHMNPQEHLTINMERDSFP